MVQAINGDGRGQVEKWDCHFDDSRIGCLCNCSNFDRLFNTLIEAAFQPQPQPHVVNHHFRKSELEHLGWVASVAPCFPVRAANITIINEPEVFYKTLLKKCSEAKRRITLASLYLGTGELETRLVRAIADNDHFRSGDLKVSVLLDYTRGSRNVTNSRTMLLPLLRTKQADCRVSLYHTPCLRGIRKKIAPPRWNEIFGTQHMKLYVFDDSLVISGANLSSDYFTNRQDRYFLIEDGALADFYDKLVAKVQEFSLRLGADDTVGLNEGWTQLPYQGPKHRFVHKAGDLISSYISGAMETCRQLDSKNCDTWIYPLVQMGQLGVEQDSMVTERLLAHAPPGTKLFMATGYFNLTSRYTDTLVSNSAAECSVLMAHPDANGFQGAKGAAGGIPAAYSLIAHNFHKKLEREGQLSRVTLQEYLRKGWTYHAKGLWYYPVGFDVPCLTLIGSPNYGERSVQKDLETQLAIITENPDLRERLHAECKYLYGQGLPADTNRDIPKWVYAMVFLFKGYF